MIGQIPPSARKGQYLRDLLYELVPRDLKRRYKYSVVGMVGSLLNPLAEAYRAVFLQGTAPALGEHRNTGCFRQRAAIAGMEEFSSRKRAIRGGALA